MAHYIGLYYPFIHFKDEHLRLQLDKTFDAMAKTCSSCNKAHRDPSGIKTR